MTVKKASAQSEKSSAKITQAIIWGIVVLAVVALGVLVSRPAGTVNKNIGRAELEKLVSEGALLVDVRSPAEYEMGIISGAINVEYTTISGPAEKWDKSKPVIVYCATGARSLDAAATLVGMGFKKVYNLTSGIQGYAAEGGSVVAPPPSTDTSANDGSATDTAAPDASSTSTASTSTASSGSGTSGKRPVLIEFYTNG